MNFLTDVTFLNTEITTQVNKMSSGSMQEIPVCVQTEPLS